MRVPTETVAAIVAEASMKMKDPNYSAVMVGGFVQENHPTAQYISAYEQELGTTEAVLNIIFLASLIGLCFQRTNNRSVPCMSFRDLDDVSEGEPDEKLKQRQPAIREYIDTNVENPAARKILYVVALAMDSML